MLTKPSANPFSGEFFCLILPAHPAAGGTAAWSSERLDPYSGWVINGLFNILNGPKLIYLIGKQIVISCDISFLSCNQMIRRISKEGKLTFTWDIRQNLKHLLLSFYKVI